MELRTLDEATAKQHYGEHEGKPFFGDLVSFITSGPLVALCVEGPDAVSAVRTLMGPTNPITAPPGSIRGDFGLEIEKNLVHGSDSGESAARELGLFFPRCDPPADWVVRGAGVGCPSFRAARPPAHPRPQPPGEC